MRATEVKVTFQPFGRSAYVLPGTLLLEAAGQAGIILQTPCGGKGTCGKCRIRVVDGNCGKGFLPNGPLSREAFDKGFRLACQCFVEEPLVVEIPRESMFESRHQILVGDTGEKGRLNPAVGKVYFELDLPSSQDGRSDVERLRGAIGDVEVPPEVVAALPGYLRANGWRGTAVLAGDRLCALETGDTSRSLFGVAADIGTTTVVATLVDLRDGRECGVESRLNPQVVYGDDVIARILRIRQNPGALRQLQQMVVETLNEMIGTLALQAGIAEDRILEIVVAGNTTMQQIFCGYDPRALGEVPFVHVFEQAQILKGKTLALKGHPAVEVFVFPQIGGFVGGDTVAGMVASRLDRWEEPVMLVDIGTNGEIVVAHDGKLLATSTAAGPAFEGARITQGMRATTGAIEKVVLDDEVLLNVIGNARPIGLCGTALIDATAGLLARGILDPTGRILPADQIPSDVPAALRSRLVTRDGETNFILARGGETASGEPIHLWQKDIRELQLATGAIRAGIAVLLRRAGLRPDDLGAVLLAGAFGNFIRRSNARRIGLLPQIPCDRIRFIGNAASLGAKLALFSQDERAYAESLRARAEHVDLSLDPDFQVEFGSGMLFPARDLDGCGVE